MIELIHGNCMDYMATLPDKAFDLGSGDPPYFKGVGKMGYFGKKSSSINVKRGVYNIPEWDNQIPDEKYYSELKRTTRNQIIWGANYYDFICDPHPTPRRPELKKWIESHPSGWIVWDKLNGNTDFNDFELAFTSFNMPTTIFTFLWNGMLQGKSLKEPTTQQGNKKLNQKRIHPTQKPIQLYKWLFSLSTFSGPILETHAGSFSAGIAAHEMGVDLTGIEINKYYYEAGMKRYQNAIKQQRLFT